MCRRREQLKLGRVQHENTHRGDKEIGWGEARDHTILNAKPRVGTSRRQQWRNIRTMVAAERVSVGPAGWRSHGGWVPLGTRPQEVQGWNLGVDIQLRSEGEAMLSFPRTLAPSMSLSPSQEDAERTLRLFEMHHAFLDRALL